MEWINEDLKLSPQQRGTAVNDLIDLVASVDGLLQLQAGRDAAFFLEASRAALYDENRARVEETFLSAYRWQYVVSGIDLPRFQKTLRALITPEQHQRISRALEPIIFSAK